MSGVNTIGSDKYQTHIDRLIYLIYAQGMVVHLRQHELISENNFLEKWMSYDDAIRSIMKFLRDEGFIMPPTIVNDVPVFLGCKDVKVDMRKG